MNVISLKHPVRERRLRMSVLRWIRSSRTSLLVTGLFTLFVLWTTGLIRPQGWQTFCGQLVNEEGARTVDADRPESRTETETTNSHKHKHEDRSAQSYSLQNCNCSSLMEKSVDKICKQLSDTVYDSELKTISAADQSLKNCECKNEQLQAENVVQIRVNNRETIKGYNHGKDLYIPFSFIQKYFDIYGKFTDEKLTRFEWKHSNVYLNRHLTVSSYEYNPLGVYLDMDNLKSSVAARERVKCISGPYGIPVSTQWNTKGYYYPIQVAQYGLNHYSKYLVKKKMEKRILIDNGTMISPEKWKIVRGGNVRIVNDADTKAKVIFFDSRGIEEDGITCVLNINNQKMVLSVDIKFRTSGKISVSVLASNNEIYTINYITDDTLIQYTHPDIYYGIGRMKKWRKLTRDLSVDFLKGVGFNNGNKVKKVSLAIKQIKNIVFQGIGWIGDIRLSDSNHVEMFLAAANWLVESQDGKGGWRVNATRKMMEGIKILPGWYTAMGQGQAISLLCRTYHFTKNKKYLETALRAVEIFHIPVENNGVKSKFMDKYTWYEEYPSVPSMHVLNGFIFSLIGLYDLTKIAPKDRIAGIEELLNDGLKSLNGMVSLYDNGQGTFYDLRHIEVPGISPNRARWQYHIVHLSQLQLLMKIAPSDAIKRNFYRWKKYLNGERAPHN